MLLSEAAARDPRRMRDRRPAGRGRRNGGRCRAPISRGRGAAGSRTTRHGPERDQQFRPDLTVVLVIVTPSAGVRRAPWLPVLSGPGLGAGRGRAADVDIHDPTVSRARWFVCRAASAAPCATEQLFKLGPCLVPKYFAK